MIKIEFEIVRAVVLTRSGTDIIHLDTTFPAPFPPDVDPTSLRLQFETRKGDGVEYVKNNFFVEPEVIDMTGS